VVLHGRGCGKAHTNVAEWGVYRLWQSHRALSLQACACGIARVHVWCSKSVRVVLQECACSVARVCV
jgi:hypothetical protein